MKIFDKKLIVFTFLAVTLFISLMIIGSVFDLEISKHIADLELKQYLSQNTFGRFFEVFGELIMFLFVSIALTFVYLHLKNEVFNKKSKSFSIVITATIFIVIALVNFYAFIRIVKYLSIQFNFKAETFLLYICCVLASGIITFSVYMLCALIDKKYYKSLFLWSILVLITVLVSQTVVQGIKPIFARPRFRFLNSIENFSLFKNWYSFSGLSGGDFIGVDEVIIDEAFKSFPSGHTTSAAISLTICTLPLFIDKFNNTKTKVILFSSSIVYVLLVAVSRIIMGAHYLTDVVFAFGFVSLVIFIAYLVMKTKFKMQIENAKNIN